MVSDLAREDIERLEADGHHLTVDEIVRLNALGLKCEAGTNAYDVCTLPRVAFLGEIVLREPTIAHEIWLDDVRRYVDFENGETFLAVHAYAYSRPADLLPRLDVPLAKHLVSVLVKHALKAFKGFTRRQIDRALWYVVHGADHVIGEYAENDSGKKYRVPKEDVSVGMGVMMNGVAVSLGLSLADIGKLTRRQVNDAVEHALLVAGVPVHGKDEKTKAQNDYMVTLNKIIARKEGHEQDHV